MLVGGVVDDQLGDDPQLALVRLADEPTHVAQRAVVGMHPRVVGDVVAVVTERGGIEGHHPDGGDPEVGEVVEARGQAPEVADAVARGIPEGPHRDLVDDRVLVPLWIGRKPRAQRFASRGGTATRLPRSHAWVSSSGRSMGISLMICAT